MIVDIIIVSIILLSIIVGIIRGFANTIIGLVSIVLSIIIAFFLCSPLATFLSNVTEIDEGIKAKVIHFIPMGEKDIEVEVDTNSVPEIVSNEINETVTNTTKSINKKKKELVNSVADSITNNIMTVIAFLMLFVLSRIILFGLQIFTEIAKQQDFIDRVDKTMGFLFGLIRGLLIVYVALGLIKVCEVMISNDTIVDNIHESTIGNYIYEHNIISSEIKQLAK